MTAKILVVDDEVMLSRATARGLKIAGYEVTTENHPSDVVRRFRTGERFDVVVSDLEMPGQSGVELCSTVQGIVKTPFILVSGRSDVAEFAARCGAAYSFQKPYDTHELHAAVAELIARTPAT